MAGTFTQTLSAALNHDSNGHVYLYAEYELHSNLRGLTVSFPDSLAADEMAGFSRSQGRQCQWDGTTRDPWIRFNLRANQSTSGGYEFVDTGSWALFKYPSLGVSWQYSGAHVDMESEYDVRQEGIVSSDGNMAYLGPHQERRFRSSDQLFRVAIPARASLRASFADVRASLRFASETLQVGSRNDEVVVVAAPSDINWRWAGLKSGSNGFWALDSSLANHVSNTWIHEYVHTRQGWTRHPSTEWLVEGTTNYYCALVPFLEGRTTFADLHHYLTTSRDSGSVLVDPDRWTSQNAHYTKGRRVVAALDAEIRRATGGNATFQNVFRRLNDVDGELTHEDFEAALQTVAGRSLNDWLRTYVEGSGVPTVPEDPDLFSGDAIDVPDFEDDVSETETEDTTVECPVCGTDLDPEQKHCGTCGASQYKQCSVCGRDVLDEPFCPECGNTLRDACDVCGYRPHPSDEFCPNCGAEV